MNSQNQSGLSSDESHKKMCAECGTSKTPLWRGGPAGPKVTNFYELTLVLSFHGLDQQKNYFF